MPEMNEMATMFMTVWFASGFVFITKIIELAAGVLLVIPRTRALGLIIITPITVGIILTEILIVKSGFVVMLPALVITILNIIGIYQYREKYLPMVR